MHFATTLLATSAVLASTAFAVPFHGREYSDECFCLSDADAQDAADIFQELIQNYSDELALDALTPDFIDYSSAVSIVINGGDGTPLNLLDPSFTSRKEFMDAQGAQPEIPFKQLNVYHGCDSVSLRWYTARSAKGQDGETARIPVVGNVIMETTKANQGDKYNFRIKKIFSEFNAAAWLVNLGVFVPPPDAEDDQGLNMLNNRSLSTRSLSTNLRGPMF